MSNLEQLLEFGKEINVLYVEDDDVLRTELTLILSDIFHTITLAKDGAEGWESYQKGKFDLVVTDIRMPHMNGIEMIEKIRLVSDDQAILVTSAHNEVEYLVKLINLAVDNFITKPFSSDQIFSVLGKIIIRLHESKELRRYHKRLENLNENFEEAVLQKTQAINEHYQQLRQYQHTLDDVVMLFHLEQDGRLVHLNKSLSTFLTMGSYSPNTYTLTDILHDSNDPQVCQSLIKSQQRVEAWEGRLFLRTKDLQKKEVTLCMTPLGGSISLGVLHDISDSQYMLTSSMKSHKASLDKKNHQDFLNTLPLSAAILSATGLIFLGNKEFQEMMEESMQSHLLVRFREKRLHLKDVMKFEDERLDDFEGTMLLESDTLMIHGRFETLLGELPVLVRIKPLEDDKHLYLALMCYQGVEDAAQ